MDLVRNIIHKVMSDRNFFLRAINSLCYPSWIFFFLFEHKISKCISCEPKHKNSLAGIRPATSAAWRSNFEATWYEELSKFFSLCPLFVKFLWDMFNTYYRHYFVARWANFLQKEYVFNNMICSSVIIYVVHQVLDKNLL